MKKLTLLIAAALLITGCTDNQGAEKALESFNLTPQTVGGYAFLSCGHGDMYATKFTATNANGKTVSGVVCRGIIKGSTVRVR